MAVWALFITAVIAFMGFGLVDPILPVISEQLGASQTQSTLLFTGYNAVMAVAMLVTGIITVKWGIKRTLSTGVIIIAIFSTLCGLSNQVETVILLRCVWGFGNSLFVATALTALLDYSIKDVAATIILFESAVGIGFSVGPLLGGVLGQFAWYYPFFGVGIMMAIAFVLLLFLLKSKKEKEEAPKRKISILDPVRVAIKYDYIRTYGLIAFLYNFGFFTLFAYAPFILGLDALGIGLVFLVWGILVAITSVFLAPRLEEKVGIIKPMYAVLAVFAILLLIIGIFVDIQWVAIVCVILSGAIIGTNNTLTSTAVMGNSPVDRPTTSASYNFLRFIGSAIAPFLAGYLGETISNSTPFIVGGLIVLCAILVMYLKRDVVSKSESRDIKEGEHTRKVEEFMIKEVVTIEPTATVRELLQLINSKHVGGVPVVDENNKIRVMLSDGDIIRYLTPKENVYDFVYSVYIEEDAEQDVLDKKIDGTVEQLITSQNLDKRTLYTISKDENFEKAMNILSKHHFKKLPVVDKDGKLEGIISRGDINSTLFDIISKI